MKHKNTSSNNERAALNHIAGLSRGLQVIVLAGGDVLQKEYGFTQKQAAEWATKTIEAARVLIPKGK